MGKVIYDQRILKPGTRMTFREPDLIEPTTMDNESEESNLTENDILQCQIVFAQDSFRQAMNRNNNRDVNEWLTQGMKRLNEALEILDE